MLRHTCAHRFGTFFCFFFLAHSSEHLPSLVPHLVVNQGVAPHLEEVDMEAVAVAFAVAVGEAWILSTGQSVLLSAGGLCWAI